MNNLARFPVAVSAVRHPRAGFESIPRDLSKAELLRYFTYTEKDVQEILFCRGASNRIGFALLLSGVRLTGRFPHDLELLPRSVLSHICEQLKLAAPLFVDYPQRRSNGRRHLCRARPAVRARRTKQILKLMEVVASEKVSRFQQLQQAVGKPSPEALARELNLLRVVQERLPEKLDLRRLHPQLLERLALLVSGAPTQTRLRYDEPKWLGLLLCWLWRLRTQLTDTALTVGNDLIAGTLRRARDAAPRQERYPQRRAAAAKTHWARAQDLWWSGRTATRQRHA